MKFILNHAERGRLLPYRKSRNVLNKNHLNFSGEVGEDYLKRVAITHNKRAIATVANTGITNQILPLSVQHE